MATLGQDNNEDKYILTQLITGQGIKDVIVVFRDDTYGNDLSTVFEEKFQGAVIDLISYSTSKQGFGSIVRKLNSIVKKLDEHTRSTTAVLAIGFDEVISIFKHVRTKSVLSKIKWYGSDGIALNAELLENRKAALNANNVEFTASIYDLKALGLFLPQLETLNFFLEPQTGSEANAPTINTYDALWIAAIGHEQTGPITSDDNSLWFNLNNAASWTYGMSTPLFLDANNDRVDAAYGFYTVNDNEQGFNWKLTAVYRNTGFSTSGISLVE